MQNINILKELKGRVNIIASNRNLFYEYLDSIKENNNYIAFEYNDDEKNLTTSDVASLRNFVSLKSSAENYILINKNIRNTDIQNSLLKLLEESSDNYIFVIIVPTSNHLLPTIRSRSVIINHKGSDNIFAATKKKLIISKDLNKLAMLIDLEDKYTRGILSEKQMKDFVNML